MRFYIEHQRIILPTSHSKDGKEKWYNENKRINKLISHFRIRYAKYNDGQRQFQNAEIIKFNCKVRKEHVYEDALECFWILNTRYYSRSKLAFLLFQWSIKVLDCGGFLTLWLKKKQIKYLCIIN